MLSKYLDTCYNERMNKKRLLELIRILRRNSDADHKLSLNEIVVLLNEAGIRSVDRKTLYDDFRILEEFGINVEYDGAYYLSEAPFSLSEVKIICDSLHSLNNLDERFLKRTCNKMYSFVSVHEQKLLEELEYHRRHSDRKFIHRLEDVLEALRQKKMLDIRRKGRDPERIAPLFLHRQNDFYYLYYHYPQSRKIYHTRFDNILDTAISDQDNDILIPRSEILEQIAAGTDSFSTGKSRVIRFRIRKDSPYLRDRLQNDFPNLVFTKDGFSLKADISDVFFARIASYTDSIKISDRDVADLYQSFLNRILICNQSH